MARKLIPQEFYQLLATRLNVDFEVAQTYWEKSIELFSDELADYGEIDLPYFCHIRMGARSGLKKIPNSKADKIRLNTDESYRIENLDTYYVLVFRPKKEFKETARGKRVTRAEIKRARSDYERIKQKKENELKQFAIMKRNEDYMKAMLEGNKERLKEYKKFNRLSKKKQHEILVKEASYWQDNLEEMGDE